MFLNTNIDLIMLKIIKNYDPIIYRQEGKLYHGNEHITNVNVKLPNERRDMAKIYYPSQRLKHLNSPNFKQNRRLGKHIQRAQVEE